MPFGVYAASSGDQVAVDRAVTDGATFAWLCDVYVAREERGNGLGTWLMELDRRPVTPVTSKERQTGRPLTVEA